MLPKNNSIAIFILSEEKYHLIICFMLLIWNVPYWIFQAYNM